MAKSRRSTITNTTKEGIFAESIFEYPDRLVVISEGDSWFSYPLNRNIADFLEMMGDFTMLRLEKNGDEARKMLRVGGAQLNKLERYFKRYGKKLNLLIFSGGGNDILDENLEGLLRKKIGTMTWRDCIDDAALAARLAEIKAAYENLLALRDRTAKNCEIVAHSYDYLAPNGRGAPVPLGLVKVGPWIKPVLKKMAILDPVDGIEVVKHLVNEFYGSIRPLASPANRFHVVDTRGTLTPNDTKHWSDEIHPTGTGARLLAARWRPVLDELFPGRGFADAQ